VFQLYHGDIKLYHGDIKLYHGDIMGISSYIAMKW